MARKAKSGDAAYNARRREYRAAQRYLKRADQTSGATAEQNRALAKIHLQNALDTYDPRQRQPISSQIVNIAAQLGMDVQQQRDKYITASKQRQQQAIRESRSALHETLSDEGKRRELEAQALISNPSIGKRIMGGLVDIWSKVVKKGKSAAENRAEAQNAIFKFFNASSWVEVLETLKRNIGQELFAISSEDEIYDTVRISMQKKYIDGTLTQ